MTGSSTSVILCFVVNGSVFSRRRIFSGWGPLLLQGWLRHIQKNNVVVQGAKYRIPNSTSTPLISLTYPTNISSGCFSISSVIRSIYWGTPLTFQIGTVRAQKDLIWYFCLSFALFAFLLNQSPDALICILSLYRRGQSPSTFHQSISATWVPTWQETSWQLLSLVTTQHMEYFPERYNIIHHLRHAWAIFLYQTASISISKNAARSHGKSKPVL